MATSFSDFAAAFGGKDFVNKFQQTLNHDAQFIAFISPASLIHPVTFAFSSTNSPTTISVTVFKGQVEAHLVGSNAGRGTEPQFTICAPHEEWTHFFQRIPKPGYQSYWSMFRYNLNAESVQILGSKLSFAQHAHIWRRALDVLRELHSGPGPEYSDHVAESDEDADPEDYIKGRYIYINVPQFGKCKVFVEDSVGDTAVGSGKEKSQILFLHTAGADSRQYHEVMNNNRLRKKYDMYAFDLPSHGRSFPAPKVVLGGYSMTEDAYISCIAGVIKKMCLKRPIVCGASMAGQVSLCVAIRNKEVGAGGVIPLEGCDHLERERQWNDCSPYVNGQAFCPEAIYGLMATTTPEQNKSLIWHMYSSSGYGIFHGDLDFYNAGWDGRDRMSLIDTQDCPVYMLTGEYDYSTSPEMSRKTASKIPGAKFEEMKSLGHFPATEFPDVFADYFEKAADWILQQRE